MKGIFRSWIFHLGAIYFVASYVGGASYSDELKVLAVAAIALTLVDALLKPLLNLLLLPFNLVTLGVFRWVSNVIALYITTLAVPGFTISAFKYPGLISQYIIIPELTLSLLGAYILLSILISFIVSLLFWLCH